MPRTSLKPATLNSLPTGHTGATSVWAIHDGKPGHMSQLSGLCSALEGEMDCQISWHDVSRPKRHLKNEKNTPQIILGAGHSTHLRVLRLSLKYRAFSTILMKPSLPHKWFNAVIAPRHDGLRESHEVLSTLGAITKIKSRNHLEKDPAYPNIVLLGGPSKHFDWNNQTILDQLETILEKQPSSHWLVFDSPRSSATLSASLELISDRWGERVRFKPFTSCSSNELSEALLESPLAWVTPDSVSMVYEALTAGCATGLFDLPPSKQRSRVRTGIQWLQEHNWLTSFNDCDFSRALRPPRERLDEATRAANWLIHRYSQWNQNKLRIKKRPRK